MRFLAAISAWLETVSPAWHRMRIRQRRRAFHGRGRSWEPRWRDWERRQVTLAEALRELEERR
jgi:hypothetical protein